MIFANNTLNFQCSLQNVPQLRFASLENYHPSCMLRAPHSHDDALEILLICEGSGIHTIGDKEYYASAGDVLVTNAGELHGRTSAEGIRVFNCTASNVRFHDLGENIIVPPGYLPLFHSKGDYDELYMICTLMYNNTLHNSSVNAEIANYYLRIFLVKIYNAILEQGPFAFGEKDNGLCHDIKMYLDVHYQDPSLSLTALENHLHTSRYHISHVFKSAYNFSPMQYVAHRRIGEAQQLLIDTNLTVTQIAMMTGFSSSNQFHHTFSKMVATSPQKYRQHWTS